MPRGLSELQKKILVATWHQRCKGQWRESSFSWNSGRAFYDVCRPRLFAECCGFVPMYQKQKFRAKFLDDMLDDHRQVFSDSSSPEYRKASVSLTRAMGRLLERGLLIPRGTGWSITPWGCLYAWRIVNGKSLSDLSGRKHRISLIFLPPRSPRSTSAAF
jgi:hypothetical protein